MKCQNGIDYDECENEREKGSEVCSECNERLAQDALNDFYGSSAPQTLREKINDKQ